MSTNLASEDLDALLGANASSATHPVRVISCGHGYSTVPSSVVKRDAQSSDPHHPIWTWISKTEPGVTTNEMMSRPRQSSMDRGVISPRAYPVPGSPASQQDLIELASSTEDFSMCSTSSDYKSCDENEVLRRADPDVGGVVSTIQIVLDPVETEMHSPLRDSNGNEFLDYSIVQPAQISDVDVSSRSKYLSPNRSVPGYVGTGGDEDCSCCSPEEEPFIIARSFPQCPSAAQLSVTSSNSDPTIPTCRICHLPATDNDNDNLISPCRCSGTMQYIHNSCLMKWLDVSSRKSKRPPSCELCLYQYHRHKKFKASHWQFPQCTLRDKILHSIFFISLLTMIGAATVTILCFKHDKGGGGRSGDKNRLTNSEIITLVCGVLFFVAFFMAMYVEVKARSTIYKIMVDFLYLNQQWYIDEYDKKADIQSMTK